MNDTICVNALLFYAICTMAAIGFVQAIWTLVLASKPAKSPFE